MIEIESRGGFAQRTPEGLEIARSRGGEEAGLRRVVQRACSSVVSRN
jgi:hypothetical protein